jgi:phosphatidylinositol N-acetylglucosaminyltransferase subunit A
MPTSKKKLKTSVALVSDFYLPSLGGVEMHIHELACRISKKIDNLIIITHQYPDHVGVRYESGFKIYYLPIPYDKNLNVIYPTFFLNFCKAKKILEEENI